MTNDTVLHPNGVADDVPMAAVTPATDNAYPRSESADSPVAESATPPAAEAASGEPPGASGESPAEAAPAEPPVPSFDDLGLHPDVKLALDEMGYFVPTAVQTAVYGPVSEGKDLL